MSVPSGRITAMSCPLNRSVSINKLPLRKSGRGIESISRIVGVFVGGTVGVSRAYSVLTGITSGVRVGSGVKVAVTSIQFSGVGVYVPVVMATAVATWAMATRVSTFSAVGALVTKMMGVAVAYARGKGVGVPN